MEQVWEPEGLISCWTLDESDWRLLANKTSATRLEFALLLKFFDLGGGSRPMRRSCRRSPSTTWRGS